MSLGLGEVEIAISGSAPIPAELIEWYDKLGYYKAPELTAECYTEDGFFKTGDRGESSPEGLLKITGRTKELFKTSKGKYVAPVPIENLLNADSHIELSCVSGLDRADNSANNRDTLNTWNMNCH